MQMTNGEIARSYKEAKDPKGQIKVLAELNCCSVSEIKNILETEKTLKEEAGKKTRKPRKRINTLAPENEEKEDTEKSPKISGSRVKRETANPHKDSCGKKTGRGRKQKESGFEEGTIKENAINTLDGEFWVSRRNANLLVEEMENLEEDIRRLEAEKEKLEKDIVERKIDLQGFIENVIKKAKVREKDG